MTYLPCIYFLRAPVLDWGLKIIENNPFCSVPIFYVPWSCPGLGPGHRHPPTYADHDVYVKLTKQWNLPKNEH